MTYLYYILLHLQLSKRPRRVLEIPEAQRAGLPRWLRRDGPVPVVWDGGPSDQFLVVNEGIIP